MSDAETIYGFRNSDGKLHLKSGDLVTTTDPAEADNIIRELDGVAILKMRRMRNGTLFVYDEIRRKSRKRWHPRRKPYYPR